MMGDTICNAYSVRGGSVCAGMCQKINAASIQRSKLCYFKIWLILARAQAAHHEADVKLQLLDALFLTPRRTNRAHMNLTIKNGPRAIVVKI